MRKEETHIAADIRLIRSTQPAYFDSTGQASLATYINNTASGILGAMLAMSPVVTVTVAALVTSLGVAFGHFYGQFAFKGYVRYFTYEDRSVGVVRTEQYRYLSYTDAQNDRGGIFMGAVDKNGRTIYNKM